MTELDIPEETKTEKIIRIWDEAEEDEHNGSTEYLMQIVCDRYYFETGKRIDNGDVSSALTKHPKCREVK